MINSLEVGMRLWIIVHWEIVSVSHGGTILEMTRWWSVETLEHYSLNVSFKNKVNFAYKPSGPSLVSVA